MQDTACREIRRDIARNQLTTVSLEELASTALRHIRQLVPCQEASVVKFDFESNTALLLASDSSSNSSDRTLNHQPLEVLTLSDNLAEGRIASELLQGKFYLVEDIKALSGASKTLQALQERGARSYLNVPIVTPFKYRRSQKTRPLGCLNLSANTPGAFTAEHVNRACEVAHLLAWSIGQASLCEQMQRHTERLERRLAETTAVETDLISSVQSANEKLLGEITSRQQIESLWRQQAERERLLGAISQKIRLGLNLKEILDNTVSEVRQLLQAERVMIYRFGAEPCGVAIAESVVSDCPSMLGFAMREPCISDERYLQQYQQGTIYEIPDIYAAELEPERLQLLEFFNIKSQLVVPLLVGNDRTETTFEQLSSGKRRSQLWGLLIAHQCSSSRHWQPVEMDWLKSVATLLEIGIGQSQLFETLDRVSVDLARGVQERTEQLQQMLKFEAVLKRITDKVRDSLDENQILQTAVQELAFVLGVENCNTAVYNADRRLASICFEYTTSLRSTQGRAVEMADFPEIYEQLLQGQPFQFCELNCDSGQHSAVLACPIFHAENAIGDLWLFKQKEEAFNEQEIRLVQMVASQCAIAIRQARLYQASQGQVEELARLNILKDDFLSTVSHELRTPLANMKMAIQMLAIALNQETGFFGEFSKPEKERNKLARYFQIVRNECDREIRLIEDLLELQRLDSDSARWAPAIVELHRAIPQIVQTFQEQARKHEQTIEVDMIADLPPLVGDPFILERILGELLTNACKYTPAGEKITVDVGAAGDRLLLSVTNSGVEIPKEEWNRIFNKFYRIPKTDRWQQGGTGLGLAVVQKLTERLGGTIQVNSEAGFTCFTVELPLNGHSKE